MAVTYVGLLRGINVGRAKRIAMADLRTLVGTLGYGDVRTLLNSGNVVFSGRESTPALAADRIEAAVTKRLGVRARVTVVTAAEFRAAAAANPLLDAATNHSRLLVAVLADPRDRDRLTPLTKQDWAPEALALGTRVAYLWCPGGVLASRVADAVDRALGDRGTMRNWATVIKLLALSADDPR